MKKPIPIIALLLLLVNATALADNAQPWAVGVSEAQKAKAQTLLADGNALFVQRKFVEALDKYKLAVQSWDHPGIRFNIVRCLIQLDRPLDASENLALALRYGAAALEDNVYTEALAYEKLLATQMGQLAVKCTQPGVRVTVDGKLFTTCPAPQQKRLTPGRHQVVATRGGYLTKTMDVVVVGGATEQVSIELVTLTKAGKLTHRWSKVVPWAVLGGGVAVAILAGSVQLKAEGDMERYKAAVDGCSTTGCLAADLDTSARDRALFENKLAIGLGAAGAATVITGGVLMYMNRGRLIIPVDVTPTRGEGAIVSFTRAF